MAMTLLATLTLSSVAGVGRFDSKMPEHSWNTLPVAYHGASYTVFSPGSIALLAKFPAVTLEKCQGWKTLAPPCNGYGCTSCCEEEVYAAVGKQIKSINPKTKVIAYFHSNKAMPWYQVARVVDNDTAVCYNGDALDKPAAPCIAASNNYSDYFYDFRKAGGAKAYFAGCRNMTQTGHVDGCFVDGCLKIEAPIGKSIEPAFMAAKLANLKALQLEVPGPLVCGSGGGLNPDMAASQVQSFGTKHGGWWGDMMHVNASASQGYMFEVHGHELCYNDDVNSVAFQTEYAAFLMFAQKWTYHICGSWCGSDPVWPKAFDMPLGEPLRNATTTATGDIWTRSFKSGTQIFFSKANSTGWVHWGPPASAYIAKHYP